MTTARIVMTLHGDCVACLARDGCDGDTARATLVLLRMILAGCEPLDIERDLCFQHRSQMGMHRDAEVES